MILSDLGSAQPTWQPNPLLQKPQQVPGFMRQEWDADQGQTFGAWRIEGKSDPLSGQTLSLEEPTPEADIVNAQPIEQQELENTSAETTIDHHEVSQEELTEQLNAAREEGRLAGYQSAKDELALDMQSERVLLENMAQALRELQADKSQWLVPLKKLSIHIAQELVRGEMRLDSAVIERLISGCIAALDQPADAITVQVGHEDMQRLHDISMPGIVLELDESLNPGSVRAKIQDTQVQDLIDDRLTQISRQILEGES